MQFLIGTSGWMYKDWAKRFYPEEMKDADKLAYFARHFKTVEINSTFYHSPLESSVQRWYDVTPEDFVFTIKLSRYITHTKHLLPDEITEEAYDDFYRRLAPLKQKLGMILVQLPPSMKIDLERIEHLARHTRKAEKKYGLVMPLAIEFRHASWFLEETFTLLKKLNIANVIIDSPDRWPASRVSTATNLYVRFHGSKRLYRSSYTGSELRDWAAFITQHTECNRVFAYFNNDHAAAAVQNAQTLRQILET